MIIKSKLPHMAYKVSKSAFSIFAGKAAATLTPLNTPAQDFRPSVSVSGGSTNTGTVTISGTLDGAAKSEVLTFTGSGSKDCTILLDTLSSITTSGLADEVTKPDILITAMDFQSTPILSESQTAIQVRFENKITSYESSPGVWSKSEARAFTIDNIGLGAIIQYNSIDYQVKNVLIRSGLDGVEVFRLLQFGAFLRGR